MKDKEGWRMPAFFIESKLDEFPIEYPLDHLTVIVTVAVAVPPFPSLMV